MEQESPTMCTYFGNETLIDSNDNIDIGNYTPVSVSPDFFGKCKLLADPNMLSTMQKNDKVIDGCLASGLCDKQMINICQVAQSSNVTINDANLVAYCKNAGYTVPDGTVVPVIEKLSGVREKMSESPSTGSSHGMLSLIAVMVGILILFVIYRILSEKKRGRK